MEPSSLAKELRKLFLWLTLACFSKNLDQKRDHWHGRASKTIENGRGFKQKWAWLRNFRAHSCIRTPLQDILHPPLGWLPRAFSELVINGWRVCYLAINQPGIAQSFPPPPCWHTASGLLMRHVQYWRWHQLVCVRERQIAIYIERGGGRSRERDTPHSRLKDVEYQVNKRLIL